MKKEPQKMASALKATAVVEVDNSISNSDDDSGSYIEVEVDSDGNEIVIEKEPSTSHGGKSMTATVKTTSASVGGNVYACIKINLILFGFLLLCNKLYQFAIFVLEIH